MKIEDRFVVDAPLDQVWRLITDPDHVAPCVPGCESVEVTAPNAYRASIKVVMGPIKTTFNITVEVTGERPPTFWSSVTRGEEGGKASSLVAHSELNLRSIDVNSTEVRYVSEVSIFGRFGKFGLGMMKKRAESIGGEFAKAFAARVKQDAAGQAVDA